MIVGGVAHIADEPLLRLLVEAGDEGLSAAARTELTPLPRWQDRAGVAGKQRGGANVRYRQRSLRTWRRADGTGHGGSCVTGPPRPLRLMAVHAHPDDESSKGAATLARYARDRVEALVVTCTDGERGDILNPQLSQPGHFGEIAAVRRAELDRARQILRVRQVSLGFADSGLPEDGTLPLPTGCFALLPLDVVARPLVRAIRAFRPHVIVTYDATGGYPHPDHVKCHEVTVEAFKCAGDPARYPTAGQPWQPLKLYYHAAFHKARFVAMHEEMVRRGLASPYAGWVSDWRAGAPGLPPPRITTQVKCGDFFPVRNRALRAHASQIDPHGFWFACPVDVERAAWPTEDYQLAMSLVASEIPEDDLFAGITPATAATPADHDCRYDSPALARVVNAAGAAMAGRWAGMP